MIRLNVLPGLVSAAALLAPLAGGAATLVTFGSTAQVTPHGLMLLVR